MKFIMNALLSRRIQKTHLVVIPGLKLDELVKIHTHIFSYISDSGEHPANAVKGSYLTVFHDFPDGLYRSLVNYGCSTREGYKVSIPEKSYSLEFISGNFCDYFRLEKILTLNKQPALEIACQLRSEVV